MKRNILSILIFTILLLATTSEAASVYFEKKLQSISLGDTFMVDVYADTEGLEVNGVEGVINLEGNINILNLITAGSVFDMWPVKPSINGNSIEFTGGSPSSVSGRKNKLFSIVLRANNIGDAKLSVKSADLFLGDGKATRLSAMGKNMPFVINKNINNIKIDELSDIILNDKIPPENFDIVIGQDHSVFDGKYFISFYTVDNQSGINRYEVRENNLPAIRATHSYVLEDQTLSGFVEVKAIDNAGNVKIQNIDLSKYKNTTKNNIIYIFILLLILILLIYTYFKFKIYLYKK